MLQIQLNKLSDTSENARIGERVFIISRWYAILGMIAWLTSEWKYKL